MLTFNEERHEYRLGGKIVPSVTQITSPLVDFSGIPEAILERKRQIGTALHKTIELYLADDLVIESISDPVRPYFDAFLKFMQETSFKPRNSEYRVASKTYQFAGTLDLDGWMNGKLSVIDFKTTYALSPVVAIQTAAYLQAANETGEEKITERFALHLKPDGTYQFQQYKEKMDFEIFRSLLNVYKWKVKNKC